MKAPRLIETLLRATLISLKVDPMRDFQGAQGGPRKRPGEPGDLKAREPVGEDLGKVNFGQVSCLCPYYHSPS